MTRPGRARFLAAILLIAPSWGGCSTKESKPDGGVASAEPSSSLAVPLPSAEPLPRVLYLPDAAPAVHLEPAPPAGLMVPPREIMPGRCPPEMVFVRGSFCIDRYEASLVDAHTGQPLSPYYHPRPHAVRREYERAQERRLHATTTEGKNRAVEPPPEWQLAAATLEPLAVSSPDAVPSGYLSGEIAAASCSRAGKRLCTPGEWVTACRGEKNRKFPYGDVYDESKCNVCRATHPARLLHGNASIGHLDPRLNRMDEAGDPLLRHCGATPACRSEWGDDAVYDMVGNLDEWVEDPEGTFLGGFYSRKTHEGCDSRVEAHGFDYYDYSLGVRCCKTP